MSSQARRNEKRAEWAAEQERNDAERRRVDALSLYDRISAADASEEVKAILLILAELTGANIYESR